MEQKDLTRGAVFPTMFFFALPMILGNLLQQAYNVVDSWVVGHFVGSGALAAVGSAFTLMTFLTSILLGLCMGSGVVFSRRFGRGDEAGLEESLRSAFLLTALMAVALTAGALAAVEPIMGWLNVPEELLGTMGPYLTIVFWGIPAVALYNFFGAYLKAVGDSVTPLVFLVAATLVNVGLDLLFVAGLGRGAVGAAAATVIAQYLSGAGIGGWVLRRDGRVRRLFRAGRFRIEGMGEIVSYSLPTCLQQSVMNFGILMVQGLVNSFGTQVMAAFAAAVKIDAFAVLAVQEYANGFSTFIAQNVGAGKRERITGGVRCAALTSLGYCVAASVVVWFLAEPLMLIFIDPSEGAVVAEGVRYLRIEGAFYCGIGCLSLFYGLYRALGKPFLSVVLTVVSLGTRVALSYGLSGLPGVGVVGIWWSIPIGWGLADLTGAWYYLWRREKLLRLEDGEREGAR